MIAKDDEILIKNNINRLKNNKYSKFLNKRELNLIIPFLDKNKIKYYIYEPYKECDKVILCSNKDPEIICYKIKTNKVLRHQDILGSIFSLSIEINNFGDIIIDNNNYYILVLSEISNYIESNLINIGNYPITLVSIDLSTVNHYRIKFKELTIITSSLRIDTIIAKVAYCSRKQSLELINNKKLLLNYNILTNNNYILKENDVFSISKIGKFKFINIKNNTKNNNYVIQINMYN